MIVVRLIGGLGNQMFQYAMGRRLAILKNVELKLDISGFNNYKSRAYELNNFNIKEEIISKEELRYYLVNNLNRISRKLKTCLLPYYKRTIVNERSFNYDPNITKVTNDVYINGYWQSEKYFFDIRDLLTSEFTLKNNFDIKALEIRNKMEGTNSVSIHIRRGDYINNPLYFKCDYNYYNKAISKIYSKIKDPVFLLFSDDPSWVKDNMKINNSIIIDSNQINTAESLFLMSTCKHNIIANSSYSWWGAWLNKNKSKMVIAPFKWFTNNKVNTTDLIPKNWEIIN